MPKRRGIHPEGQGWEFISEINPTGSCVWKIYIRDNGGEWVNFKIAAKAKAASKANYSLGWNGERFALSHDYIVLVDKRPKLYDAVIEALKDYL